MRFNTTKLGVMTGLAWFLVPLVDIPGIERRAREAESG